MKLKDLRNVKLNQIMFTKEKQRKYKCGKLKFKVIKIYARYHGKHYHIRECIMLNGGEFEKLGYAEIPIKEIKLNKLKPCNCIYTRFKNLGYFEMSDKK